MDITKVGCDVNSLSFSKKDKKDNSVRKSHTGKKVGALLGALAAIKCGYVNISADTYGNYTVKNLKDFKKLPKELVPAVVSYFALMTAVCSAFGLAIGAIADKIHNSKKN